MMRSLANIERIDAFFRACYNTIKQRREREKERKEYNSCEAKYLYCVYAMHAYCKTKHTMHK